MQKIAVLLRMLWGPFKIPSKNSLCCHVCSGDLSKYLQKNRCAVTYALGTLKNAFKKFAVLLRMQWGPLKIPSKNRCAVTYAVGTLQNAFNKIRCAATYAGGPLKMPITRCCYFACKITCLINCNQSRKIHAPNLNPNSYQPLAVRMR